MRLDLRASTVLTLLVAAVHCAAAAVLWAYLPSPAGVVAGLLSIGLGVLAIRDRTLLSGSAAWVRLELGREGVIRAITKSGFEFHGQVAARRYVSRWLVVLPLVLAPRGRGTILVARDMLAADDFRHLRLWALWNALPIPSPAAIGAQDA